MFYVLIAVMVLCFTVEGLLWKHNKRDKYVSMFGISVWSGIAGVVFGGIWTIFQPDIWQDITRQQVLWVFVISIAMAVRIFAWLGVLKRMHISIADPLCLMTIVALIPLAWFFFGGAIIWIEIVLLVVILIFGSSLGYFQGKYEISNCECGKFKKGLGFLLLWEVFAIPSDLLIQYVSESGLNPAVYQLLRKAMVAIIVVIVLLIICRKKFKGAIMPALKCPNFIIIGIASTAGGAAYFALAGMINVGILNAINVATSVLIVLGGTFLFKERIKWYSYIFIAVVLASIIGLSILSG